MRGCDGLFVKCKRRSCFNKVVNLEAEVEELRTRVATLEAQVRALLGHREVEASASPKDALERQVIEFILAGRTLQAVKLYHEKTGLGLKESKDAVDKLVRLYG